MTGVQRFAAAILLVASLAACSSVSTMYDRWFGSAPAVKPAPLVAFTPTAQARIVWQANVGAAERSVFFPAVSGNTVYAASVAGQIVGFDTKSGQAQTRINAGQQLSAGVAASGSLVLVGTVRGELLAHDANGKQLWRAQLAGEV